MAAYYVLLRPWLHFGYGEGTVRLLSVIPGVLSIPLMYLLGRKLFGQRTAILAALFLAFNACAVFVSQEARAYSFVVLAVLLSTYLFGQLIESPTYSMACAYAVVAGLSCYFHYFCVLVPAAHYLTVFGMQAERRPWKPLLLAAAIVFVIAAPILWLIHAQDTGHISWVQPPSWLEVYHLGAYLAAASGKAVGGVLLALNLVLAGFFVRRFRQQWSDVDGRGVTCGGQSGCNSDHHHVTCVARASCFLSPLPDHLFAGLGADDGTRRAGNPRAFMEGDCDCRRLGDSRSPAR